MVSEPCLLITLLYCGVRECVCMCVCDCTHACVCAQLCVQVPMQAHVCTHTHGCNVGGTSLECATGGGFLEEVALAKTK